MVLHSSLGCANRINSRSSTSNHLLRLFKYVLFGLPRLLFPSNFPVTIIFSSSLLLITWPKILSDVFVFALSTVLLSIVYLVLLHLLYDLHMKLLKSFGKTTFQLLQGVYSSLLRLSSTHCHTGVEEKYMHSASSAWSSTRYFAFWRLTPSCGMHP